jgi:hypothetical protein
MTTKKILLIVGGVVLALGLLIAVFAGGVVGLAFYSIGNSEAADTARTFLSNNEALRQDIGKVTGFGKFVTGTISSRNQNGEATLNFKVIGEHKTVNASVSLIYLNGRTWRVSSASYENEQGQTVSLLNPYDSRRVVTLLVA